MTKEEYLNYCLTIGGATVDQPFREDYDTYVVRHRLTRRWFALVMDLNGKPVVNLKCEPMQGEFLRGVYKGVIEAYHMNKRHWITVFLNSDVPAEEIYSLTQESFHLTEKKMRSPRKKTRMYRIK